ncbi:hypothetical protein N7495_005580 [Penicillium taxi]|uniref:uncharacterized protein n=1 Tax=Penicillium taxi TaxID=168475 RepID=UPI0025456082|nr:uncharacterized protein N7495_005580 [Penicillium taxi]KAJ5893889.1 hypothetical protein N7495_005580 [Penicillium taxi]
MDRHSTSITTPNSEANPETLDAIGVSTRRSTRVIPSTTSQGPLETIIKIQTPEFQDRAAFFEFVLSTITQNQGTEAIFFTGVKTEWGPAAFHFLESKKDFLHLKKTWNPNEHILQLKMPTVPHNSAATWFEETKHEWVLDGQMTRAEAKALKSCSGGDLLDFSQGPYRTGQKGPDFLIIPKNKDGLLRNYYGQAIYMPTLAMESGWLEGYEDLLRDMNMLLVGGNEAMRVVFLVVWSRQVEGVYCRVEKWTIDRNGIPRQVLPSQVVFPRPDPPTVKTFSVTFDDLFGCNLRPQFPNRNKRDTLTFDVNVFRRDFAVSDLEITGYQPL